MKRGKGARPRRAVVHAAPLALRGSLKFTIPQRTKATVHDDCSDNRMSCNGVAAPWRSSWRGGPVAASEHVTSLLHVDLIVQPS